MKIMVLCSQVCDEVIEIVNLPENVIHVRGDKRRIFRHPKGFGKPGFFWASARSTQLNITRFLSEGQVFRMRKSALKLHYDGVGYFPDYPDMQKKYKRMRIG